MREETPVWVLFGLGLLTIFVGVINIIFTGYQKTISNKKLFDAKTIIWYFP